MNKIHLSEVDSTNLYLKNNYKTLDDLTFLSCDYQNSGKGRLNRKWFSDKNKNLLFSLLIKDEQLIKQYKSISILTAYCIIKCLEKYGLKNLSIKWPNDVYVNDKKICGILLEAITVSKIDCLIVGVGLNVNQIEFSDNLLAKASSIKKELNQDIDIEKLKNDLYTIIEDNLNRLLDNYDFYLEIEEYDYLKNKEVYATINNQKEKVVVEKIDKDYSLIINMNGKKLNVETGEISFR